MACTGTGNSNTVTETVNGSHHFTVNGYSLVKGMGVGKFIASDCFSAGEYQWAIYYYPDGKNAEDNSTHVSVFIALVSEGTDVRALFELTLLDQSGKGKHKVHSHFDHSPQNGPYTLKGKGSMWGYKRFFRRAVLETSDFVKNDSLAFTCRVEVVVSPTQAPLFTPSLFLTQTWDSILTPLFSIAGKAFMWTDQNCHAHDLTRATDLEWIILE